MNFRVSLRHCKLLAGGLKAWDCVIGPNKMDNVYYTKSLHITWNSYKIAQWSIAGFLQMSLDARRFFVSFLTLCLLYCVLSQTFIYHFPTFFTLYSFPWIEIVDLDFRYFTLCRLLSSSQLFFCASPFNRSEVVSVMKCKSPGNEKKIQLSLSTPTFCPRVGSLTM